MLTSSIGPRKKCTESKGGGGREMQTGHNMGFGRKNNESRGWCGGEETTKMENLKEETGLAPGGCPAK